MPTARTSRHLSTLAEEQWGLLTRRQVRAAGVSAATVTRLIHNGVLDRVAQGVYRLSGTPLSDHIDLRAAWLQLAPETLGWERTASQGVVSHRSAATLYGIGHLPADRHEFILPRRRQSRRPDVRLHLADLSDDTWTTLRGLPVTRPSRIAADLMSEREDPAAVAHVVADAIRGAFDHPATIVAALARYAAQLGEPPGDGVAALRRLLNLVNDPDTARWLAEATDGQTRPIGANQ